MREIKFRAWDKAAQKFRGLNGVQDLFSVRSDGYCHEDYILNQYTGLKDKNGVEIYEGDILKFENSIVGSIKWGYNGFNLTGESCITNFDAEQELEVVGNIYQMPELLEVTA